MLEYFWLAWRAILAVPCPMRISGSPGLVTFVVWLAACGGDDGDPSIASSGEGSTSEPLTGSATGGPSSAGTAGDEPTTGGGGVDGKEVCERYIECVAVTVPNGLPATQDGFGDNSNCWKDPEDAELCVLACQTALEQSHEAFPDEPKCGLCRVDADCGPGGGCNLGECVPAGCGNGTVEPSELCDGLEGCALDCQSGAMCSPLTGVGCPAGELCGFSTTNDVVESVCYVQEEGEIDGIDVVSVGAGEACGIDFESLEYYDCSPGLVCAPQENTNVDCQPELEGCCMAICDLGAPACPMGWGCVAYSSVFLFTEFAEPALGYIGLCDL